MEPLDPGILDLVEAVAIDDGNEGCVVSDDLHGDAGDEQAALGEGPGDACCSTNPSPTVDASVRSLVLMWGL